jgi:hypothetical protein
LFLYTLGLLWTTHHEHNAHNELLHSSLTCEEGGNLSTRDLGFTVVFKFLNVLILNIAEKLLAGR